MIRAALARLLDGHDLTRAEAREVMGAIMTGQATPAQIGGFLVALRLKGETADEIAGAAEAMRAHVVAISPRRDDLVDTAGTGGDGAGTWNISTVAALIAAAAGAGVAKHGNRAASSATGAADVLEALGFELAAPPGRIERSIDELGFGFLFAPAHHPAMAHAAPVRRELAARTIFNVLGPLTNPAGARAQVVGVYSAALAPTIAEALVRLDARRAFVVHGADGIDELSPTGANLVCEVSGGRVRSYELDPLSLGVGRCDPGELRGGDPETNARGLRDVLEGAPGGHRSAALLNAAGAIAAAGHAADLREGLAYAREAIDSGAAAARLEALIAFSRGEGALARGAEDRAGAA
jgi:anthranilate phosphoribosyltransferase